MADQVSLEAYRLVRRPRGDSPIDNMAIETVSTTPAVVGPSPSTTVRCSVRSVEIFLAKNS